VRFVTKMEQQQAHFRSKIFSLEAAFMAALLLVTGTFAFYQVKNRTFVGASHGFIPRDSVSQIRRCQVHCELGAEVVPLRVREMGLSKEFWSSIEDQTCSQRCVTFEHLLVRRCHGPGPTQETKRNACANL